MKTAQDRYFECLEVCIEDEQGMSCRQVCAPILNDDPSDHPTVPIINNMWAEDINNFSFNSMLMVTFITGSLISVLN